MQIWFKCKYILSNILCMQIWLKCKSISWDCSIRLRRKQSCCYTDFVLFCIFFIICAKSYKRNFIHCIVNRHMPVTQLPVLMILSTIHLKDDKDSGHFCHFFLPIPTNVLNNLKCIMISFSPIIPHLPPTIQFERIYCNQVVCGHDFYWAPFVCFCFSFDDTTIICNTMEICEPAFFIQIKKELLPLLMLFQTLI